LKPAYEQRPRELEKSFDRNPSRVAKTVSFSTRIKPVTRLIWHCGRSATSGSGVIKEVRLIPAPGAEDGVSSLHIAIFVQLKAEVTKCNRRQRRWRLPTSVRHL
jgi:hypothetical protein